MRTIGAFKYNIVELKNLKHFWEVNPQLTYIPELNNLTARDVTFVLLYTMPLSPFLYLKHKTDITDSEYRKAITKVLKYTPSEQRKVSNIVKGTEAKIEKAIEVVKSLMPFHDDELNCLITFMNNYKDEIKKKPADINDLKKIADVISKPTYTDIKKQYLDLVEASRDRYEFYLDFINPIADKDEDVKEVKGADDAW